MTAVTAPIKRVAASHELLWNLTLRELRTKYRKSVLGWTWSMLNPLATVAIYSFVFGHLFGTSLPIGGPSTHSVLTGHTGLSTATMFDNLNQLKKGDVFYVSSLGQTLKYEVNDITVVKPEDADHPKWQAAQARQGGDGDGAGGNAAARRISAALSFSSVTAKRAFDWVYSWAQ